MTASVNIKHIDRLGVLAQKKKRIKLIVGGRASTKSTFVADHCLAKAASGLRVCCAREYLNSIDDSVHESLKQEAARLNVEGIQSTNNNITSSDIFSDIRIKTPVNPTSKPTYTPFLLP